MKKYQSFIKIIICLLFIWGGCLSPGYAASPAGKAHEKPLLSPKSKIIQDGALKDLWKGKGFPVFSFAEPLNRQAIGCVLPLTGRFADAGNRALDAILLSADIFNAHRATPWKINVADSGGTAKGTRESIAYLADVARVMAIVAITGTAEAVEAACEAQKKRVPLILITSREGVTNAGDYVFQHFLTPSQQITAIASYAKNSLNSSAFAILYPRDDYGKEMSRLFLQRVRNIGSPAVKVVAYDMQQVDFTKQIQELTGNSKLGGAQNDQNIQLANAGLSSLDFDTLFIPDSPRRVKMIAEHFAFFSLKGIQFLGTSLWHSPELLRGNVRLLEGSVFTDSFLVNSRLPETSDFMDAYYLAYSRDPDSVDALAYDTIKMTLKILDAGQISTREEFLKALAFLSNFRGVTGKTSFNGGQVSQKDAFILKVQNGQIEQVR